MAYGINESDSGPIVMKIVIHILFKFIQNTHANSVGFDLFLVHQYAYEQFSFKEFFRFNDGFVTKS